jgi:hypothetical protein
MRDFSILPFPLIFHAAERSGRASSPPEGQFEEKSPDFHNRADTTSI